MEITKNEMRKVIELKPKILILVKYNQAPYKKTITYSDSFFGKK